MTEQQTFKHSFKFCTPVIYHLPKFVSLYWIHRYTKHFLFLLLAMMFCEVMKAKILKYNCQITWRCTTLTTWPFGVFNIGIISVMLWFLKLQNFGCLPLLDKLELKWVSLHFLFFIVASIGKSKFPKLFNKLVKIQYKSYISGLFTSFLSITIK